jgi:hypothetical protein
MHANISAKGDATTEASQYLYQALAEGLRASKKNRHRDG